MAEETERLSRHARRARGPGLVPNEADVIRPIGAVPADTHDESAADERRWICEESMAKIATSHDNDTVALTEGRPVGIEMTSKPTTVRDSQAGA